MEQWLATAGSIMALVVAAVTAYSQWAKVRVDRRHGIGEHEMSMSRFGLESLQASLAAKDALISQYRERIDELDEELDAIRAERNHLLEEVERLKDLVLSMQKRLDDLERRA